MTRLKKKILFSVLAAGVVVGVIAVGLFVNRTVAIAAGKEARVTQIVRDVKLLSADAAARSAAVNDRVKEDTSVRTGGESRSELTFVDLTIARLGANTIFAFNQAGRNAQLEGGSVLLRVPKNSGGATIRSAAVTVAITGTTVIFESDPTGQSKLIVLEGAARVSLVKPPGQSREVRAGQALDVPAGATTLPLPTFVDLDQIMKTNPLITDFAPLPSRDLIAAAAVATETERLKRELAELSAATAAKKLSDTQARAAADAAALAKLKADAKTKAANKANAKTAAKEEKPKAAADDTDDEEDEDTGAPISSTARPWLAPASTPTTTFTRPPTRTPAAPVPIAAPVPTPPIDEIAETPPPDAIAEPIPDEPAQATPCDDCPGGKYEREREARRARELAQHDETAAETDAASAPSPEEGVDPPPDENL